MDVVIPFVVFLGLGSAVVALCVRTLSPDQREWMKYLLVACLLLRLGAATLFVLFPGFRLFHEDATGYEYNGMLIATMWRGEYPPFELPTFNYGFLLLAGILNYVFGRYQAVLSYFNCIVGTLLIFCVYRLAIRFFHPAVGRLAALMVGLMPSMILWSSVAVKDVLVTLLLVIALSSCVSLKERVTVSAVAGIILPVAAIQGVRFYMVYFVGFAIAVSLVLDRGSRFLTGIYKQLFLVFAALALFAMVGLAENAEESLRFLSLEQASSYRRGMAISARSGFDVDVDVSTPGNALAYLPVGMAQLLWAPFPWQMVSLGPLLAAPETILWWFLFPATIRGIVFAIRRRFTETSALIIFSVTVTCAYSLIHGNVGSAFRQRSQILVFLFIFCAAGIYLKRLRKAGMDPARILTSDAAPEAPPVAAVVHTPARLPPLSARRGHPPPTA